MIHPTTTATTVVDDDEEGEVDTNLSTDLMFRQTLQRCRHRHRSRWKWRMSPSRLKFGLGMMMANAFFISCLLPFSSAIKNEFFPITTLCQRGHQSFLSNIPHLIDGAVVISHNERDMDCIVTFQTDSILEKFMVRFEDLKIDCNDQLFIYDGAHAIGNPKVKISCDKTISNIGNGGTVYTQTNFLTLKYVTDSWGTDLNGFKMIITAFKDSQKKGCRDGFQCDDADICIHNDLVCDTVNHCGDGGDERSSQFCTPLGVHALSLLDTPTLVAIIFGCIFVVLAGLTAYLLYTCRRQDQTSTTTMMMTTTGHDINNGLLHNQQSLYQPAPSKRSSRFSRWFVGKRFEPCAATRVQNTELHKTNPPLLSVNMKSLPNDSLLSTNNQKENEWFV